ncbi:3-deoxy-manno-octulosonate cytidylyltransferase [Rhizorhapis suberifaciens]|uniref:3-deoxy-manno-octulosonate cytidylyltransferase (CMP-KDO synthetase) n=1 Tax=Rhizorhapis suberifaciens TaxID=13656 RepID=A0A840HR07_9SPHN|nr:manno-octulosonate cytidylyltransferase [Rhizorhapis suberifaciens]MBB4640079.1 3-deoxy-manno-octulosonate cytidylyltransferase (CMP-KDO synthetase) [Rhizorhapis suberifaciens]
MKTVIVIPARYASSRYPGKPLVELKGSDGVSKPLIQRTWETALAASGVEDVFVATDDDRIAARVRDFGGKVIMTSENCANGTERCAEALANLQQVPDLIVNLQGDAPLTPFWFLEDLIAALGDRHDIAVATPVLRCNMQTYAHFRADRAEGRVGGTTAVFGRDRCALYFSKEVVPYLPQEKVTEPLPVFHHVGVYAYRPEALSRYSKWTEGPLEANEGLEQLRFLENGERVLCVEVDARGRLFWELNNPVDVARIEEVL